MASVKIKSIVANCGLLRLPQVGCRCLFKKGRRRDRIHVRLIMLSVVFHVRVRKHKSRDGPPPSTVPKIEALARPGGLAIVEIHAVTRSTFDRIGGLARRWRTEANAIAVGWLRGSVSAFNNSRLRGIIPLWSQAGRALQGR